MPIKPEDLIKYSATCQKMAQANGFPPLKNLSPTKQPYCALLEADDLEKILCKGKNSKDLCPYMSTQIIEIDSDAESRVDDDGNEVITDSPEYPGCNWPMKFKDI